MQEVQSKQLARLVLNETMTMSFKVTREKAENVGAIVGRWVNVGTGV